MAGRFNPRAHLGQHPQNTAAHGADSNSRGQHFGSRTQHPQRESQPSWQTDPTQRPLPQPTSRSSYQTHPVAAAPSSSTTSYQSAVPSHQYDDYSRQYHEKAYETEEITDGVGNMTFKDQPQQGGYAYANPMPGPGQQPAAQTGYPQPQSQTQYSAYQEPYGQSQTAPASHQQMPPPQQHTPAPTMHTPQQIVPDYVVPCHPNYISMTVNAVPNNQQLRLQSRIPVGMVLHPLADPPVGEDPLPAVNFGSCPVIRCKNCRTYVNPYVAFLDGGKRWRCNLCTKNNDVPGKYYSPLDAEGKRIDLLERPELIYSSIEIIAPPEYTVRPPQPPVYVFAVDVSQASIESGMVKLFAQTILETLDHFPGDQRTMVGFITFDSTVHFYNLTSTLQSPQMIVCSDIDDIFLPQPEDLLVYLEESRHLIEALLESLPDMHQNTTNVESAVGPAVIAAQCIMQKIGGKMLLFTSGLASLGTGRLKNREDESRLLGTDKEHTLLRSAHEFYKNTAAKMTRLQISADVFQFSEQYADVSTVSCLAKFSGGSSYFYDHFSEKEHGEKFCNDLQRNLTRTCGWEAVMRIRVGKGLSVQQYYGNFWLRSRDLMSLPNIDCDKAFSLEVKHEDKGLPPGTRSVSVQAALLYTTSFGERRIRIHTHIVPVVATLPQLFPEIYVSSMCNLLAKKAIEESITSGLRKGREMIQNCSIGVLRAYRGSGQSYLPLDRDEDYPEHLRTLPAMVLGLLKNECFRDGRDVRSDVRAAAYATVIPMGVQDFELYVRPRMLPLHTVESGSFGLMNESEGCELPPEEATTATVLTPDSAFLIDNGQMMIIRLGREISPKFLQEVCGVPSLEDTNLAELRIEMADEEKQSSSTSIKTRVSNIIQFLRAQVPSYQNAYVVVEGDMREQMFINLLIEDRTPTVMGYDEFLQFIVRNTGV